MALMEGRSICRSSLASSSSSLFMEGRSIYSLFSPGKGRAHAGSQFVVMSRKLSGLEEAMRIRRSKELQSKVRKRPPLRRGKVSSRLLVPEHVLRPPYVATNQLPEISSEHQFHNDEEIIHMKASCDLAARVLDFAGSLVKGLGQIFRLSSLSRVEVNGITCRDPGAYQRHVSFLSWLKINRKITLSLQKSFFILFTLFQVTYYFLVVGNFLSCYYNQSLSDILFFQPSVTTDEIDKAVHKMIIDAGAYPSPLGYGGFPKSVCTSVNECMCHGIPDSRQLQDGDIINIDVTVYLNGYHGDTSRTYFCGNVDEPAKRLVNVTEECLEKAISICKDGASFKKIGKTISDHAERYGCSVVERFVGHGVGRVFHSEPIILHNRNVEPGFMVEGETFTIEPILTLGSIECITWEDGWTTVTADGSLAAQFEHTILITKTGAEVLTKF